MAADNCPRKIPSVSPLSLDGVNGMDENGKFDGGWGTGTDDANALQLIGMLRFCALKTALQQKNSPGFWF